MKIVDKTPFMNEKGEIGLVDRIKVMLKFGKPWMDDLDAQKSVIPVLEKSLDKGYTLLRNFTLPDVAASIPMILVGPPGIFVIYVTNIVGLFRAKGDQWGTVDDNSFKQVKPNLLTRTESMARAVQVYLQRHGYNELTLVEPILLCSDPRVHVDSLRPIVRVVMRDALERLALSISQARPVYSPEAVFKLVNLFMNLPQPKPGAPAEESSESVSEEEHAVEAVQSGLPVAIQLPGDELFPRGGPSPRLERPARSEQPRMEEEFPPIEQPPMVEQAVNQSKSLPGEPLPANEQPSSESINPWEEQPPHQDSLPADKPAGEPPFAWVEQPLPGEKDLPGVKPVDEIKFAWEEPSPQEESGNSVEKPSGEALFPWEEQSPEKENPLPAEKSARGLLFPWEEQPSQEEKNLPAEKPAREPLFPWIEPAPPPDQPAKEEQSSWTEEYPAEEQPQGASWLPQGDQTSAAQPPVEFQDSAPRSAAPRIKRFSRKQWIFLAAMLFIWLVLVVIFIIKVVSDLVL